MNTKIITGPMDMQNPRFCTMSAHVRAREQVMSEIHDQCFFWVSVLKQVLLKCLPLTRDSVSVQLPLGPLGPRGLLTNYAMQTYLTTFQCLQRALRALLKSRTCQEPRA